VCKSESLYGFWNIPHYTLLLVGTQNTIRKKFSRIGLTLF
jgi:hypothetical protein